MDKSRITNHPILASQQTGTSTFFWKGEKLIARKGEMISSALFANGIRIFGNHPKDASPQGLFCANGQCSQCLVIANGKPVKSCMTPIINQMEVEPVNGLPDLPSASARESHAIPTVDIPVFIIGGGPAGMSAALELARSGIRTLVVDDKQHLGGKLVLQTHRFFGSTDAVYAGTRGIDIATKLAKQVQDHELVDVWMNSTAVAVFSDQKVGILRKGTQYVLISPRVLLVASGAREKSLTFSGNTLPGVYGAGAFQTLVNRDLVKASDRLFIVGGGNVGLIAGYHALQAGIEVVGLAEALPDCGGYKVHADKLARMGVPIYTSHTVTSAKGDNQVRSVTICKIDDEFQPIDGTEKTFACDTVLIAVGLDPVDEFYSKAQQFGMNAYAAGDAEEIAEASAAIFSGKITGRRIARSFGSDAGQIPATWRQMAQILKSPPGATTEESVPECRTGVFPVLHCSQEIPCNPCTSICPQDLITIEGDDIRKIPRFAGETTNKTCVGCERCVAICPGLAITLVDYRQDSRFPTVTLPYEFTETSIEEGQIVTVVDTEGVELARAEVTDVKSIEANDRTLLVKVRAKNEYAKQIAGIRIQEPIVSLPFELTAEGIDDRAIICRCERVTAAEIRKLIQNGCRDINEIKAVTRAGMGACGGKTCVPLIKSLFREEGIDSAEVTDNVERPLFVEVPLGVFAGNREANCE